jgi:hypothetical protein
MTADAVLHVHEYIVLVSVTVVSVVVKVVDVVEE